MEDQLKEALDHVCAIVDSVPAERFDDPTPCEGWDVGRLVNHMVASNLYFAAAARGEEADRALYEADHLGDDAAGAYRRSATAAADAWARPGVLDEKLASGMPGQAAWGIYLVEVLGHGWDLARATDQDPTVPEPLCEAALEIARTFPAEQVRQEGVFGDEVTVGADASAFDRLAAFLGRTPA